MNEGCLKGRCGSRLLCWVRGNSMLLRVSAKEPLRDADGAVVTEGEGGAAVMVPLLLSECESWELRVWRVGLSRVLMDGVQVGLSADDGSVVLVELPDTLKVGEYAVELRFVRGGAHGRSFELPVFRVVESNGEAKGGLKATGGMRSADIDLEFQVVPAGLTAGRSAYEEWRLAGHEGSQDDFLQWLLEGYATRKDLDEKINALAERENQRRVEYGDLMGKPFNIFSGRTLDSIKIGDEIDESYFLDPESADPWYCPTLMFGDGKVGWPMRYDLSTGKMFVYDGEYLYEFVKSGDKYLELTVKKPLSIWDLLTQNAANGLYQPKGDYLTEHQSLEGYATERAVEELSEATAGAVEGLRVGLAEKEDRVLVVAVDEEPGGEYVLDAEVGRYYRFDGVVESLLVRVPAVAAATAVCGFVVLLTTGAMPDVTISAGSGDGGVEIGFMDGYEIGAEATYELNVMWNGRKWIVAYGIVG